MFDVRRSSVSFQIRLAIFSARGESNLVTFEPTTYNSQLKTHNSQLTTHNLQLTTQISQLTTLKSRFKSNSNPAGICI